MPRPEGYRKAMRLMQMAERFKLPLLTFIDTPGAYPGVDAEKRGQSEAIARNLFIMSDLKTPIISTVIGDQYSTYSVISPEGCSTILWKSADNAADAAEVMGLTAQRLSELGLNDGIIEEPLGGAHRDVDLAAANLKKMLLKNLEALDAMTPAELLEARYHRLRQYGVDNFQE